MTSHTPPRLSSNVSHQPWRQFDEKSTYLSSLSSTLKTGRSWLASSPRDSLPTHHHQKSNGELAGWRGSPEHRGFLSQFRRATRKVFRSSNSLPNFTLISRRAPHETIVPRFRPLFPSLLPPFMVDSAFCTPLWTMVYFIGLILQHGQGNPGAVSLPRHPHICAVWLHRSVLYALHVPHHSVLTHAPPNPSYF